MIASTLSVDPLEEVAAQFGGTPGFLQLYSTPTDRDLAASLVSRAEAAGYGGIVVTLDTWLTGWRRVTWPPATSPSCAGTAWPTTSLIRSSAPALAPTRPAAWR